MRQPFELKEEKIVRVTREQDKKNAIYAMNSSGEVQYALFRA